MEPALEVGGIVFQARECQPQVLLVGARKAPGQWIFPKGHLEPGESAGSAALREVNEEAGVEGRLVGPVGEPIEFRSGAEPVRVQYFLIQATRDGASPEGRPKQWLPIEPALSTLSFEESRRLLRAAAPQIQQAVRGGELPGDDDRFVQLLLAEYEHVAESLLRNEEDGEKRVAFFLSLAGGVGALLGFAVGREGKLDPGTRDPLVVLALLVLAALGYLTLIRVVSRNAASDRYKRRLGRVRRYFLTGRWDPRLRFLAFDPYRPDFRKPASWRRIARGGWFDTIAVIEALLVGALVAASGATGAWAANGILGLLAGGAAWAALVAHGRQRYREQLWEARDGLVLEHAFLGQGTRLSSGTPRTEDRARRRLRRFGFELRSSGDDFLTRADPVVHATDAVLVVTNGVLTVTDVEQDETVTARTGDAVFIPRDLRHCVSTDRPVQAVLGVRRESAV
jgi:diadenosine hexaphosphate hydrolase (ATP-forming)